MASVEMDVDGRVAVVTLNRPDRMNTMNEELLDELLSALERAASDPELAVVVLTGNGRAFCAGGDLDGMGGGFDGVPRSTMETTLRRQVRCTELLRGMDKVTVAMVNGACAGAGLGLAAACDLRFAAEGAVFRVAFLNAAMSGDFATAWLLSRLLGEARARELYFMDEKIRADEALRIGLVTAVYPPVELEPRVREVAERLAESAPMARRGMKANLNEAATASLAEALSLESPRHVACAYSEDAAEAGKAFLERRTPTFVGR